MLTRDHRGEAMQELAEWIIPEHLDESPRKAADRILDALGSTVSGALEERLQRAVLGAIDLAAAIGRAESALGAELCNPLSRRSMDVLVRAVLMRGDES